MVPPDYSQLMEEVRLPSLNLDGQSRSLEYGSWPQSS